MDDAQLQRYARHILLDPIGIEGQQRWLASHALVVGAGGLGCAAALYLAASGVGRITLVDGDAVDLTNLQRQIGHTTAGIGTAKVLSLAASLRALNPGTIVQTVQRRADAAWLEQAVPTADVVLDCSDNFATRQAVNRACVAHAVPLVAGAALRFDGQLTVVDPRRADGACYACSFDPAAGAVEGDCATLGVFAPLVGQIGTAQAAQALLLLAGIGEPLVNRLALLDGQRMRWDVLATQRRSDCPVCGPLVP